MTVLIFLALMILGVPVFAVLVLSSMVYIGGSGHAALFDNLLVQLNGGLGNFSLLAIPLFIIAGELMNECGITTRLIALSRVLVGSVRGGLAYVNILANAMMAAIIGSAIAQTAVMTRIMVPEMERAGYPKADAAAMTCAGGLLGPIIPPSMPLIIFAVLAQVPVADMLISGLVPGLIMAASFLVLAGVIGFRRNYPRSEAYARAEALKVVVRALPALLVPLAIVATIVGGFGSPTEAAASAALVAILIGAFVYRELDLRRLPAVLERAGRNTAMVLAIVAASAVFGWVIIYGRMPARLAELLTGLTDNKYVFLLIIMLALLVLGTLIDGIAALIITVPILLPIATGVYGLDPVHLGIVVTLTLVVGLLTPPVGAALYVASGISGVRPIPLFRAVLPYIAVSVALLLALCFLPVLSTVLIR